MENEKDDKIQQNTKETPGTIVLLEKKHTIPFKKGRGSGFFITPDKIATNIHVLTGAGTISAKCIDTNTVYTIEGVVAFDDINDLVILKVAAEDTPFALGDSNTVQIGDTVCAIGHSVRKKMIDFQLYKLSVSLLFLRDSKKSRAEGTVHAVRNSGKWIELNMPDAEQGYSGGPVLNSTGEVIAILYQGSIALGQAISSVNRFTAISANRLKELLTGAAQVESIARWQKRPRIRAYTQESCGHAKGNEGNYKGAIAAYNKAIELNPDLVDVYINRGTAKGALGDFEGAIEDFNTAIRLNPEDVSAYNNRGNAKKALGNTKEAIADYNTAIQLDPENIRAYYNRGITKEDLENYNGAIEDYDMAIQLNPEDADIYYIRGVAKNELGDFEGAMEDYDMAIQLNPEDADIYYSRGNAKNALGDTKSAIENYDMAIRLNPEYTNAYNNRGNAKETLGDVKGAINDYDNAIQLNPEEAVVYYNRGIAKNALGDTQDAIEDYDMAIKLNPKYVKAYKNRGRAKQTLGQQKAAEADFAKAKELETKIKK